jgi:hypothetical protein
MDPASPVFARPERYIGLDLTAFKRLSLSAFHSLRKVNKKAESADVAGGTTKLSGNF